MHRLATRAGIGFGTMLLLQSALVAPAAAQEQAPAATAPAWSVTCGAAGQSGHEAAADAAPDQAGPGCAMTQRLAASPEGPRVLQVTLRPHRAADVAATSPAEGAAAEPPRAPAIARMRLDLPLGVDLPSGVGLLVDGQPWTSLPVRTCLASGCYAGVLLREEDVAKLKRGNRMGVAVRALNGRTIAWPVTLAGFTASFDRMMAGQP